MARFPELVVCGALWHPVASCGALWRPVALCGALWRLVKVVGRGTGHVDRKGEKPMDRKGNFFLQFSLFLRWRLEMKSATFHVRSLGKPSQGLPSSAVSCAARMEFVVSKFRVFE